MDSIRVSAVNMYHDCPAKFEFTYIDKVYNPSRIALAFGTSIHNALKKNYAEKIFTKKDLSIDEITSEFSDNYDSEMVRVEIQPQDEPVHFVKDAGVELLTKYQKEIAPRIQPAVVEQRIAVNWEGSSITLNGTLDLIDEDEVLIDHKTTRKAFKQMPLGYIRQLSGYNFLANSAKRKVSSVRIDLLTAKSSETNTSFRHLPIEPDIEDFLTSFSAVVKAVKAGVFMANRNSFLCNRKYCSFWQLCEQRHKGTVK